MNKKEFFYRLYSFITNDRRYIERKENKYKFIEWVKELLLMLYVPTKTYTGGGVYKPFIESFGVYLSRETLDLIMNYAGLKEGYISKASLGYEFEKIAMKHFIPCGDFDITKEDVEYIHSREYMFQESN